MGRDNIREWTGLEVAKVRRAVENREKMEKTGCKIICGAPTTLVVKELMMMMMMIHLKCAMSDGLEEMDTKTSNETSCFKGFFRFKKKNGFYPNFAK